MCISFQIIRDMDPKFYKWPWNLGSGSSLDARGNEVTSFDKIINIDLYIHECDASVKIKDG